MVLLRLLLQWSRADFRNPVCQAIVQLTNPLIVPLRRVLPPIGKIDTASCVAVILVAAVDVVAIFVLRGVTLPAAAAVAARRAHRDRAHALWTYFFAIILYALLSLVAPGAYSPLQSVLISLCEPVLRPFRRFIPPLAGLDLSPLWATLILLALLLLPCSESQARARAPREPRLPHLALPEHTLSADFAPRITA